MQVGPYQRILVSFVLEELLVVVGVATEREDPLEVAPPQELLVQVHQHLELVLRQLLCASEAALFDLTVAERRCEGGQAEHVSGLSVELCLVIAAQADASKGIAD